MRRLARVGSLALALLLMFFGYSIAASGFRTVAQRSAISAGFAAYGWLWIVAGPAMFAAGAWMLAGRGRSRAPFWMGGMAALAMGGSLIAGVLSYVIPCSGPD